VKQPECDFHVLVLASKVLEIINSELDDKW
jgi:hypothetical protein